MPEREPDIGRVTRSRVEARGTYDRISRWYDLLGRTFEQKTTDAALAILGAGEGEVVLEIGCGIGRGTLALAQSVGHSGKVYALDLSPRMLDITRARADEAGLSERVELRCGDAVQLPFQPECFDALFMTFTLELFDTPEIPKVLQECWRVLRREGRVCVVSLSKAGKSSWMRTLYEWGHDWFPKLLDCRPILVRQSLEEAGFQTLDAIRTSLWRLPVEIVLAAKR